MIHAIAAMTPAIICGEIVAPLGLVSFSVKARARTLQVELSALSGFGLGGLLREAERGRRRSGSQVAKKADERVAAPNVVRRAPVARAPD